MGQRCSWHGPLGPHGSFTLLISEKSKCLMAGLGDLSLRGHEAPAMGVDMISEGEAGVQPHDREDSHD